MEIVSTHSCSLRSAHCHCATSRHLPGQRPGTAARWRRAESVPAHNLYARGTRVLKLRRGHAHADPTAVTLNTFEPPQVICRASARFAGPAHSKILGGQRRWRTEVNRRCQLPLNRSEAPKLCSLALVCVAFGRSDRLLPPLMGQPVAGCRLRGEPGQDRLLFAARLRGHPSSLLLHESNIRPLRRSR